MNRLALWSVAVLALLLVVSSSAISAPSCGQVVNELAPCLSFVQGGQSPSQACCTGIKDMKNSAKTKADGVAICNCCKQALSTIKYDPKRIPLLPKQCGVNLNLPPIDKNTDCSKVGMGV